jgi:hypothetical protein
MPSQTVGHALQDPNIRAERFVERWQERQGQRQQLRGWQHDEARGELESQMAGLTKSLERDLQERNQQDWWLVGVGACCPSRPRRVPPASSWGIRRGGPGVR